MERRVKAGRKPGSDMKNPESAQTSPSGEERIMKNIRSGLSRLGDRLLPEKKGEDFLGNSLTRKIQEQSLTSLCLRSCQANL